MRTALLVVAMIACTVVANLLLKSGAAMGQAQGAPWWAVNWRIVEAMKLPAVGMADITNLLPGGTFQLIVDALFGTGLRTPPRRPQHIEAMNRAGVPILAVDVPSGLDCDTGEGLGPACVRATRTVTFVAEKVGFSNPIARQYLGDVIVGDIGCPRDLIDSVAAGESCR